MKGALFAGLGAALCLRLWGVEGGLPYVFHPDENRQILDALGMAERLSLLPEEHSYPALHKYMLLAINGAYFAAGRAAGWFADPIDFAFRFLTGESRVFLLGRLLSVFGGVAVCIASYAAGKRVFSEKAGLVALLYTAGMFHLVQHSQWAVADIFIALFTLLSLSYSIAAARDEGALKLAAAFTGLAISTKPQGLFLLVPFFLGQWMLFRDSDEGVAVFARKRVSAVLLLAVFSAIGNLSWVFSFNEAYTKFMMLTQVTKLGISSREPFEPGIISLALWFIKELARQEGPLGAVLLLGVVYSMLRGTREDVIYLSYIAVFMLAMKDWAVRYLHLFVALFPVMCLFGARFTEEILMRARARAAVTVAFVLSLVLPSAADSVEASYSKRGADTRLLAKSWMEENIPPGSRVAMDWHEFSVPLWSDVPLYLQNPKARERYVKRVPEALKARYRKFLEGKKAYKLLPIVYTTATPSWPAGMGAEAVKKAEAEEVYRELYSVFNFHTIEELRGQGAGYIVISSYGYTNFLLDDDPEKNEKAVFNYLFKEDLLGFNKQSDEATDDRFGLLVYLNRRARDFYVPLLRGRAPAALLKEFTPVGANTGPVIKVYRITEGA